MKTLRIKDICDKGSSNLKQKDVQGFDGKYPVYGASGVIGKINDYHQDKEYIAIVKDGSGIGRVSFMPAYSSVIGTLQYILPKQGYNIKYISYCLQSLDLASSKQGAAIPHIYFRDYGEFLVNVEENIDKQQQIVSFLDSEFEKIEALKANAETQLQAAKDLFQKALKELLTPKEGWVEKKLVEVCKEIFSGGDAPKENMSKEPTIDFEIPIYANAAEFDGLYGYTNYYRVNEPSVTIAARGSGTGLVIKRKGAYLPIVRLIVVIPNTFISVDYLYFALQTIRIKSNGAAIPQLTVPVVKQYRICYPPNITEQQRIAAHLDALSANVKALQTNYAETIALCNDLKQALLKKVFG